MNIRPMNASDIPALMTVLDGTALFPGDMLPEMASAFLADEPCEDVWLSCEIDGQAIGFCYAAPEEMTEGAWNMLAIAVLPAKQGEGGGGALVAALEAALRAKGGRILIADTSGADAFAGARAFYKNIGYAEEARIRDFWAEGDDKVVFWKAL